MPGPELSQAVLPGHAEDAVSASPFARLTGRWTGLDRGGRIFVALVVGVVALRALLYPTMMHTPPYGDEHYYVDGARALSNLLRDLISFNRPDGVELNRNLVGNGWFMPGMAVLTTPLFLVVPDAPIWLVRAYLGLVSTGVLLTAVFVVRHHLGRLPATAMLVFPGLVPMYAVFAFAAYGDQIAGLLIVVLICRSIELVRRVRGGDPIGWRQGVDIGLLCIGAVYFRSSASVLVVGVCAVTAIVALVLGRPDLRLRVVGVFVAAGAAFVGLLLPWSAYASHELGGRILTTTSVPIVTANTFGNPDDICYGTCDPGSTQWFSPLRYSREVGRAADISEMQAAKEMSFYARTEITPQSYSRDVLLNLSRYLRNPGGFAMMLMNAPAPVIWLVFGFTTWMVYAAFFVALLMLGVVVRRDAYSQLQALLIKVAIAALMLQPFVHVGGSRYWTSLAPLLGLSAVVLWSRQRAPAPTDLDAPPRRWLTAAQMVQVTATALVALGIVVVAIV